MSVVAVSFDAPGAACISACLAAVASAWGLFLVRGSTAVPAAGWAILGCVALALEMAARSAGGCTGPTAAAARLAVVALGVCPAMALLGAKRPQHGVWQLIVATLAVVLAMPAVAAVLIRPGSLPHVHILERCLMPALVLVGWMNFVATRRAAAATCIALGQLLLLRGFLPGMAAPTADGADAAAAALVLAGATAAAVQGGLAAAGRRRTERIGGDATAKAIIDRAFLPLRETFGAAWTLRIAERFNAAAAVHGWPCRLGFHGLEVEPPSDDSWCHDATRAFRALARRFVDDAWLRRHGWPREAAGTGPGGMLAIATVVPANGPAPR